MCIRDSRGAVRRRAQPHRAHGLCGHECDGRAHDGADNKTFVHADDRAADGGVHRGADDGRADVRADDRAFINTVFIDAHRGPHGRADAPAYHHTVIRAHAPADFRGILKKLQI